MENLLLNFFLIGTLFATALVLALNHDVAEEYGDFKPVNIFFNITQLNSDFSYLTSELQVEKS